MEQPLLIDFPYDQSVPLDVTYVDRTERRTGTSVRDVTFDNSLGSRVSAFIVTPPPDVTPPFAGVVWLHWLETSANDSNRSQFLDEAVELSIGGVVSILPDGFWSTSPTSWAEKPEFWWKTEAAH